MEGNRLISIWPNGDDRDGYTDLTLYEGNVVLEFMREVCGRGELGRVALPTLELGVDRAYRIGKLIGEVARLLTIDLVVCADADRGEAIKDVALHHDQAADTIEHHCIAQSYEVKPTAAAAATCHGAELMTQRAELFARFVEELRGEGTRTDTGAVSLEDPVNLADLSWSDAETRTAACADCVARGDEGIGAEVDI